MKFSDSFSAITAVFLCVQKIVSAHRSSRELQVTFGFTVQSRILDPHHGPCLASPFLFLPEFGGGGASRSSQSIYTQVILVNYNFMKGHAAGGAVG